MPKMLDDSVFVTVLSRHGGTVTVTSGNNAPSTHHVPAGSHAFSVPMGVGKQVFKFQAKDGPTKEGTSTVDISDQCWVSHAGRRLLVIVLIGQNGIYNYNFHSGSVKL
jgi:glucan endo-1,3-alpha-glucosidase